MRIVISNPDNLGDVMLREPMFSALHEAGHELLLIARDFVAPLVRDIAPYAELAICPGNPYDTPFRLDSALGIEFTTRIRQYAPDLFVAPSFQFTELEQSLAACLPEVESIGLSGYLYQRSLNLTAPTTIRFSTRVQVSAETPEPRKNELLCGAILGGNAAMRAPRLAASAAGRKAAAAHLRRLGLKGESFWAVCAGDRPPLGIKNWDRAKWTSLCGTLIEKHGLRLLFIGTPEEDADTRAIQESLGDLARRTATITGGPIAIPELVALLDAAHGYIGKDTGPMHLAAALDKPVVAVLGGGHWQRFAPLARTGAVFTLDVPCQGCDWNCPLTRAHCVKDVPVAPVLRAVEDLLEGKEDPFQLELLTPDGLMEASLFQELREAFRRIDEERGNFSQWHNDRIRDIETMRLQNEQLAREVEERQEAVRAGAVAAMEFEIATRNRALDEATERIRGIELELAVLTATSRELREERSELTLQLAESRVHLRQLEAAVEGDESKKERAALEARIEAERGRVQQLEVEVGVLTANEREFRADREHLRIRIEEIRREATAEMETRDREIAQREAALEAAQRQVVGMETELAELKNSVREIAAERDQALARSEEMKRELAEQRAQLVAEAESQNSEARRSIQRLETELGEQRAQLVAEAESQSSEARRSIQRLKAELVEQRAQLVAEAESQSSEARRSIQRLETELGEQRAQLVAEAESQSSEAMRSIRRLETGHLEKSLRITQLQAEIDTIESRHLGRVADLANTLSQLKRENQLALSLVPELRDELMVTQRDLGELRGSIRQFGRGVGERESDANLVLTSAATRLHVAENQVAEFTASLRTAAGEQARGMSWREDLQVIERDREARLAAANELAKRFAVLEAMYEQSRKAESEVAEFSATLRTAAGEQARGMSWREDLQVIEQDRETRLAVTNQLAEKFQLLEAMYEQSRKAADAEQAAFRSLVETMEAEAQDLRLQNQKAQAETGEFANRIQMAAGEAASTNGWREDLAAVERDREQRLQQVRELAALNKIIETDREQRLQLILDLSEQIRSIEADRELRGQQIESLHRHVEALGREKDAITATLSYRIGSVFRRLKE